MEDEAVGHNDIILGIRVYVNLALSLTWSARQLLGMRFPYPYLIRSIKPQEITLVDNNHSEVPKIVQKAVKRLEWSITSNEYNDYNRRLMMLKYAHLSHVQKKEFLHLILLSLSTKIGFAVICVRELLIFHDDSEVSLNSWSSYVVMALQLTKNIKNPQTW
jgi:hypothetical protein